MYNIDDMCAGFKALNSPFPLGYCNREWPLRFSNSEAPLPGDGTPDRYETMPSDGDRRPVNTCVGRERPYLTTVANVRKSENTQARLFHLVPSITNFMLLSVLLPQHLFSCRMMSR